MTEKSHLQSGGIFLVETIGVEPMTSCMSSMRSNQLSYASVTNGWYYTTLSLKLQALLRIFLKKLFCLPNFKLRLSLRLPLYSGVFTNIVNLK